MLRSSLPASTPSPLPVSRNSSGPAGEASVALLAWSHFLNDGAANYLPGILPALLASLAIPLRYAGAIMAILVLGQALQVVFGALADRWGGRNFLLLGLAGSSLGAAWVGWARRPEALVAALVLISIANSAFHPPAMTGARRVSRERGDVSGERAMGVFSTGGELGRGVWPLIASVVVTAWGLASLWVLTLAAVATLPVLAWKTRRPRPVRASIAAWSGVRQAGRPLQLLVGYSALRSVVITGVSAFVPFWWEARGGKLVSGAALITVMLLVGVIGNLGAGALAARVGQRRVVILGTGAACLLLAGLLLSHGIWVWLAIGGLGMAVFATLPVTVVMGQDLLPNHPSLGSGLSLGFANAVGAIGVGLLGLMATRWAASGVLWSVEVCAILALFAAFRLRDLGGRPFRG